MTNHDETVRCFYCNNTDCDCIERIECSSAGEIGHISCGWCVPCKGPQFECACRLQQTYQETSPHNTGRLNA